MLISFVLLCIGILILVKGAGWLVDGASSLAARLGIAPIVIGLTIVAFGTSAPELVVNLVASVSGKTDIAIGNIIGSNIANILLILGISGCIYPLTVKRNTTWKEIPLALLAVVLVWVMANDQFINGAASDSLSRIDGIALLSFFLVFLYYTYGISKGEKGDAIATHPLSRSNILVLSGFACLILGGKLVVDGAVSIAETLNISERLIGLTIVAVGTSLPELLTSAVAAFKKKSDIAIGNVVGSNIFNIFWILGLSSVIRPLPFSPQNGFDGLVAVGATILLFLAMFVGKKHILERWQASVFLMLYVLYIAVLILKQ